MNNATDQVTLETLVFSQNWEDPNSDITALQIQPGDRVFCITSGGCNTFEFLLHDPEVIYSADINPAQSYLLELKMIAMEHLEYDEYIRFLGLSDHPDRWSIFRRIQKDLSGEAIRFWQHSRDIVISGLLMNGRYEQFLRYVRLFLTLLQGRKRISGLLKKKSLQDQHVYFDQVWDTSRFYYVFQLFFNKRILAKRGLVDDYFHFDDGSDSFAESFYHRARKAFREIPVHDNYFLSLYLTGRYQDLHAVPAYLRRDTYHVIKSRLDRIKIRTLDAQSLLQLMPIDHLDCLSLSNICELMSESETCRLFQAVQTAGKQGAHVLLRNLMVPRDVPADMAETIKKDVSLSDTLLQSDRSFVYGKVAAYTVHK